MNPTKRRHYRVTGQDLNGIHVSMLFGDSPNAVHLIDISTAGAAVAFLDADRSDVEAFMRSSIDVPRVRIESERLPESLDIACRVAHLQQVKAGVVCGVAFLRRVDETVNLDRALLRVFNRRGAVRVEPDFRFPIPVRLLGPSGDVLSTGRLRDLSLTGIGMVTGTLDTPPLTNGTDVMACFDVDGSAMKLKATVRFSKTSTATAPGDVQPITTAILGVEFGVEDRDEPSNRKIIANWVMRRQLEIQRIQREAADSGSDS